MRNMITPMLALMCVLVCFHAAAPQHADAHTTASLEGPEALWLQQRHIEHLEWAAQEPWSALQEAWMEGDPSTAAQALTDLEQMHINLEAAREELRRLELRVFGAV
ncbi:MAG: hypothetical protein AAFX99_35370 [Myxococcota bacterium]